MLSVQSLTEIELGLLNQLNEAQRKSLEAYPDEAQLFFDWVRNDQIPSGTVYEDVEIYYNGERMIRLYKGAITGGVGDAPDEVETLVIWGNGECIKIDIGDTVIMDRTRLCPVEIFERE